MNKYLKLLIFLLLATVWALFVHISYICIFNWILQLKWVFNLGVTMAFHHGMVTALFIWEAGPFKKENNSENIKVHIGVTDPNKLERNI